MKRYTGTRTPQGCVVMVMESGKFPRRLDPRRSLKLANRSPDGFEWGYGGSGPAQLALALLLDVGQDEQQALAQFQAFKFAVCARMPKSWELTQGEIEHWLAAPDAGADYFALKWDGAREEER